MKIFVSTLIGKRGENLSTQTAAGYAQRDAHGGTQGGGLLDVLCRWRLQGTRLRAHLSLALSLSLFRWLVSQPLPANEIHSSLEIA